MTKPAAELSRRALLPAALAALFMLAGCGIKGPLELPEGTQVSGNEGKGKGRRSPASGSRSRSTGPGGPTSCW